MQASSANQHQVTKSDYQKCPCDLRKNTLGLSQSAFSNFALYVIKTENLTAKLQNSNQNFALSWVSLIRL